MVIRSIAENGDDDLRKLIFTFCYLHMSVQLSYIKSAHRAGTFQQGEVLEKLALICANFKTTALKLRE